MKNFMKRTLALALALVMALSLAACGSKDNGGSNANNNNAGANTDGDNNAELTSYYIGYNTWSAGTAVFDFMADIVEQALDAYGAEYTRSSDETTADKELQNIQNFISAGVDGIVMQTAAETVFPQAAEECGEAGVPFVMSVFTGTDEDRATVSAENEYYVGSVNADMYAEGYMMGQAAAADGHKTAVLLGGNVGDTHFEMRIAGFTQAFVTEAGGEILNTARCANPSEGQEKANAMLSATPDADCLFAMAGDYVPGAVSAMDALGLDMPMYVTNADTSAIEYIRNGRISGATTGNDLVGAVASALLINYLDGHKIVDENGKAPELKITGFLLTPENIDDYEAIFANEGVPFTEEVLQTLAWRCNPDVTYATFTDFIANEITMEAITAAHNK